MTPDQRDAYEERAAIMEYLGGLSRVQAEHAAARAQGVTRDDAIRHWKGQQK